jgi:hypothetical protein
VLVVTQGHVVGCVRAAVPSLSPCIACSRVNTMPTAQCLLMLLLLLLHTGQ